MPHFSNSYENKKGVFTFIDDSATGHWAELDANMEILKQKKRQETLEVEDDDCLTESQLALILKKSFLSGDQSPE